MISPTKNSNPVIIENQLKGCVKGKLCVEGTRGSITTTLKMIYQLADSVLQKEDGKNYAKRGCLQNHRKACSRHFCVWRRDKFEGARTRKSSRLWSSGEVRFSWFPESSSTLDIPSPPPPQKKHTPSLWTFTLYVFCMCDRDEKL